MSWCIHVCRKGSLVAPLIELAHPVNYFKSGVKHNGERSKTDNEKQKDLAGGKDRGISKKSGNQIP